MLKRLSEVVILLLCSIFLFGFDSFNKEEITLGAMQLGVAAIDYQQTKVISRNPDEYFETNPVMGRHPSEGRVTTVFLATAVAYVAVAYVLPREITIWSITLHPRMYWQLLWLGSESEAVFSNWRSGIRIKF